MHVRRHFVVCLTFLAVASLLTHAAPIDSSFLTTYSLNATKTTLVWQACTGYGCSDNGPDTLGPFGRVAAMIEGNSSENLKEGTVSRDIYIVDAGSASDGDQVTLYVYREVITPSDGLPSAAKMTLLHTVPLMLTGGSKASVSMAATSKLLYIGTNLDEAAIVVSKSNPFAWNYAGGVSSLTITSITSDQYGYVTITSGTGGALTGGSSVISPDGMVQEELPQSVFILNTVQSLPAIVP
jgi:hypothetical protein